MNRLFQLVLWSALITLLCPAVYAQELPACASQCLESALKAQNTCASTDIPCICSSAPLMGSIEGCVLSTCTLIQGLAVKNATDTMCGVPLRDLTHITPIVTGISGGLATISIIVRCSLAADNFALDDFFAVASLAVALPMGILEFVLSAIGFGRDVWTISPPLISRIAKYTWLTEILFFFAVALTKISFLLFLLRIFPGKKIRRVVHVFIAITATHGFSFAVACVFNCTPISYTWTLWDGEHTGKCINLHLFAWIYAGTNVALDFMILAIPIPELLSLSLHTKKKVYIITMFNVGIFATIVSIIRLQTLVKFSASMNPTYDNVPTAYWAVLEVFVGIFCVCMPAMRRLLAITFPQWFGFTQPTFNYGAYGGPNTASRTTKGRSLNPKGTPSFNLSSFAGGGIMKTMETKVESNLDDDDEIELVKSGGAGNPKEGWLSRGSEGDAASGRSGRRASQVLPETFIR